MTTTKPDVDLAGANPLITLEALRERLLYDQETGVFIWRLSSGTRRAGANAGYINKDGYLEIKIDGRCYAAHRLAWLYTKERWPVGDLDHRNGKRNDNRLANLREATRSQNIANAKRQSNNTSGFKGVHWAANEGRWRATIRVNKKPRNLGAFDTAEAAHEAYCRAAIEAFGEFARLT